MRYIELTREKRAVIDSADFEWVSRFKWCSHIHTDRNGDAYAVRRCKNNKVHSLHRDLMNAKKGQWVDHINGDTLDNRRSNLRICTNRENVINSKRRRDNTTGYRGVVVHKQLHRTRYVAQIQNFSIGRYIGIFDTAEEAAQAYDKKAKELFGEYARFNFPEKSGSSHLGKAA